MAGVAGRSGGKRPNQGRKPGSKNKATIEREAQVAADRKRIEEIERLRATGASEVVAAAQTAGVKLMKDIAFDFAQLFAGLAAFYQPYPSWGRDALGKPVNANPNYDEAKFEKYATLATHVALGAAPYQSPRLSAVMVGAAVVTEIEMTGGLPDEEDGGLNAGPNSEDGDGGNPRLAASEPDQSAGVDADVSPEAGGTVSVQGEAEGGPLRKAMG